MIHYLIAYLIERSLARLEAVCEGREEPLAMPAELVAYFDAGAIVHAVQWGVQEGFPLAPEEMARHVMRLIASGTFSLFEGRRT